METRRHLTRQERRNIDDLAVLIGFEAYERVSTEAERRWAQNDPVDMVARGAYERTTNWHWKVCGAPLIEVDSHICARDSFKVIRQVGTETKLAPTEG